MVLQAALSEANFRFLSLLLIFWVLGDFHAFEDFAWIMCFLDGVSLGNLFSVALNEVFLGKYLAAECLVIWDFNFMLPM